MVDLSRIGGQAAIRLLVDHADTGLLGWLPGGFPVLLTSYVVVVAVGVAVTAWAHRKARALGRRG